MNTITKVLAPAALALFAFGAQAATISTGGETYQGNPVAGAVSASSEVAPTARVSTGGEGYVGVSNAIGAVSAPAIGAGMSDAQLERLYIG